MNLVNYRRGIPVPKRFLLLLFAAICVQSLSVAGPIPITAPTTLWTVVSLGSLNQLDYFIDQQTGQPESDIVGTTANPGFYYNFDNNGAALNTDGTLSFRVRLAADTNPAGFDNYLFIGILANAGDSIDMFVGVQGSGSASDKGIKIWAPGAGLNVSPNTTTISAPAAQVHIIRDSSNYHFAPVTSPGLDPNLTNSDLDAKGDTDYFISFSIPFSVVVSEAQRLAGLLIDDQTALRFVLATATNQNSFNQDIGGVNGGVNSPLTYSELGATSTPIQLDPAPPPVIVPEPGTWAIVGLGLVALAAANRRRRRA